MQKQNPKILVIGDVMLDRYHVCSASRMCQESPGIPILDWERTENRLGGAANVAVNIASVGATVDLLGVVGKGPANFAIQDLCLRQNVGHLFNVIFPNEVKTTIKERWVIGEDWRQHMRMDTETKIDPSIIEKTINHYKNQIRLNEYRAIIISDYGKGVICEYLMEWIQSNRQYDQLIIVDPHVNNTHLYGSIFAMTPNKEQFSKMKDEDLIDTKYIVETLGKNGINVHDRELQEITYIPPVKPKNVYNVSGAGDTVSAIFTVALCMRLDVITAAKIANAAASRVVSEPFTARIGKEIFDDLLTYF